MTAAVLVWATAVAAGCSSVLDLKTGQCFDGTGASGTVSTVQTVDCAKAHVHEVFAVTLYPATKDDPYPGEQAIEDRANADCPPAFQAYVGIPFDQSVFEIFTLTPSADTWKSGDRSLVCTLSLPDPDKLTGSAKDSNR